MTDAPLCQLTALDMSVLEGMMDRLAAQAQTETDMARLLRRKLAAARMRFRDDIDPRIATINSRIQFRVGSGNLETCVLTHGGENALPGTALPVSTLFGLALLGLMEGESIAVDGADGKRDVLHVVRVIHQPEAASRSNTRAGLKLVHCGEPHGSRASEFADGPEDDDPGPRAA